MLLQGYSLHQIFFLISLALELIPLTRKKSFVRSVKSKSKLKISNINRLNQDLKTLFPSILLLFQALLSILTHIKPQEPLWTSICVKIPPFQLQSKTLSITTPNLWTVCGPTTPSVRPGIMHWKNHQRIEKKAWKRSKGNFQGATCRHRQWSIVTNRNLQKFLKGINASKTKQF